MHTTIISAISFASIIGLVLVWRILQLLTFHARERLFSTISKWVFYTLVLPRQKGSTDVSLFAACLVALLLVGNVAASVIAVRSRVELSIRLARLCAINFVVLFVGGRTNLVIDKMLRWSMTDYYLFHRWIGRVSVVEALIHGIITYVERKAAIGKLEIAVNLPFISN